MKASIKAWPHGLKNWWKHVGTGEYRKVIYSGSVKEADKQHSCQKINWYKIFLKHGKLDENNLHWIKSSVQSSEVFTECNKHLKKVGEYAGWNIMCIMTEMSLFAWIEKKQL